MRFTSLSLITVLVAGGGAFANEHGGGGGGAVAEVPRDQREYVEKTTKLGSLATKLEESEKTFAHLVHEKDEAATAEAKQPLLKELVELAKQRNVDVAAYNKLKDELTLRYPNQGEHLNRHFGQRHERSAAELERDVHDGPTLDELLTETKRLIEDKYAPFDPRAKRAPAAAAPHAAPDGHGAARGPRLRLEK